MKIGIIGFGNLGRSLASGLVKSGTANWSEFYICDASPEARNFAPNAHTSEDFNFVIENTDVIFLVVKSYVFDEMLIDKATLAGKTVISFMAGVTLEDLRSRLGDLTFVLGMPSLAIAECEGVIGYTKAPADVADIFHKLGYAIEVLPKDIFKIMAFAACGLGFAAYLIDTFAAAGLTMGFSPEESARIAAQTFKNAIDRGDFKQTAKAVATPGGATEQGLMHFDECGLYDIVAQAMQKAYDRMA
ncbi:MAG: NAD(P)-binding domain-containing protein [Oscillospiraceae bacterium]|nr:NAD(P)-binding domain-containing protein [Oscillospiraceae bacterium]